MMPRTSGTACMISRCISRSVSAASSTLMVGCLRRVTTGVPSSITGMKVEPMRVNSRPASTSPASAAAPTSSGLRIAQPRKGS